VFHQSRSLAADTAVLIRSSLWAHHDQKSGMTLWGRKLTNENTWEVGEIAKKHKWQTMSLWMKECDVAFVE